MKKLLVIFLTVILVGAVFAALPASAYNIVSPTAPTYTETPEQTTQKFTIPFKISEIIEELPSIDIGSFSIPDWTIDFTNSGKDDPDSPNYTGKVTVSRDDSGRSPDTAAGTNTAPVIVAVITLMGAAVFAGTALGKKKDD